MKHPSVEQILERNEEAIEFLEEAIELLSKRGRNNLNGEVRKIQAIQILRGVCRQTLKELSKIYRERLKQENKCLSE